MFFFEHHGHRLDEICGGEYMRQEHIISALLIHLKRAVAAFRCHDDLCLWTDGVDQFDQFQIVRPDQDLVGNGGEQSSRPQYRHA